MRHLEPPSKQGLYDPRFEHDGCGVGFVADIGGHASHRILALAIEAVTNVTHRGAVSADGKTGDGAGVLTQLPGRLVRREAARLGARLEDARDLGLAMVFLPREEPARGRARALVEELARGRGLGVLGWREVPLGEEALGARAAASRPSIQQLFLLRPPALEREAYERELFLLRKAVERRAAEESLEGLYVPSLSSRTVTYKGLLVATQLAHLYPDLTDPDYETALAVFHQRYSTNTFPTWRLAQPFRFLAHNGEINTLMGNRNWTRAREAELRSPLWGGRVEELKPVVMGGGSDSMSLDNALELLVASGRDILEAFMLLVPEAWENMPLMPEELRAFHEFGACLSEPWDGPAAIAFTDGRYVGGVLDRNGLRPARYKVTEDGLLVLGSEVGVVEIDDARVVEKGRLGPGQMVAVDTARGVLLRNGDIKGEVARRRPYGEWLGRSLRRMPARRPQAGGGAPEEAPPLALQQVFGYTAEDFPFILKPMLETGKEPVGSMGDDTPLSVLSKKPRLVYTYVKQLFAQVTNPPIDHLREELVMSLYTYLGARGSLLESTPEHAKLVRLESPFLLDEELEAIRGLDDPAFRSRTLPCLFEAARGPEGLGAALEELCQGASEAVDEGVRILILSDRGVDAARAPIPMPLAVGAVQHHLIREGRRMRVSLIAETGEAREVHHFGVLVGFGASAVNPYLAVDLVRHLAASDRSVKDNDPVAAVERYRKSVKDGLRKIISKMGISTVTSYHGGQVFEVVGLNDEVVERCFAGTASRVRGAGFGELAEDVLARHARAYGGGDGKLDPGGYYRYRRQDGEYHAFNPDVVKAIHRVAKTGSYEDHKVYAALVNSREPLTIRDLLRYKAGEPVPLEEVEPIEAITRRFVTAGMSLGALSQEAHENLAIAMNRLGGKSNTGEGGEDPRRYQHRDPQFDRNSRIKQVASARFGVTPEYLVNAEELEIKMAQGSKPGEGGQLPGHKVTPYIAKLRLAVPGLPLISPAPHHDIYSIEDLAQLIYDLKQVNPRAKVCVKLVAEAGVGTIAAGVAKAYADFIQISGHDGGTGASPLSGMKNAGSPWEIGLAETQQVLVMNDLRGRVGLRTDGGMKTGRDVVMAALLGADEYGFGTAPLVASGCVMARQCHLNTCPVGVTTHREDLRAKFTGTPEGVVNFFRNIAQEVREILSSMGFRSLEEVIGRTDLLEQVRREEQPRAQRLDLSAVIARVDPEGARPRRHVQERNDRPDVPLDLRVIEDARPALERGERVELRYAIRNVHRSVGTRLAGEVARRCGNAGLPEGAIRLHFTGSAGQSFGAFSVGGITLLLEGEANDYVGKGLHGGEIILRPPAGAPFATHENVVMGNTVLYGATGGYLFAAGRAGERFAVRNSAATAVVEGVGDHGCEYMTGGVVVVLGTTGRNFGAGMTNGLAYVLDEAGDFPRKVNPELVDIERVASAEDARALKGLIRRHLERTESPRARHILERWEESLPLFWKVVPRPSRGKEPPPKVEEPSRVAAAAGRG